MCADAHLIESLAGCGIQSALVFRARQSIGQQTLKINDTLMCLRLFTYKVAVTDVSLLPNY